MNEIFYHRKSGSTTSGKEDRQSTGPVKTRKQSRFIGLRRRDDARKNKINYSLSLPYGLVLARIIFIPKPPEPICSAKRGLGLSSLSTKKDRTDQNDFDSSYKEDRLLGLPRGYS